MRGAHAGHDVVERSITQLSAARLICSLLRIVPRRDTLLTVRIDRKRKVGSPEIDLFRQVQGVFGANVRAKRMALGWTQSYLAERAGIAKWEILRIEQGSFNITLKTITRLVAELGETMPVMLAPVPDTAGSAPRRVRSIYRE